MDNRYTSPTAPRVLPRIVSPGVSPPTHFESILAQGNANGRPNAAQCFTNAINPNTGRNYRVDAVNALNVIEDVTRTYVSRKAIKSSIIRNNLLQYESAVQVGVTAKAIFGACYGYNVRHPTNECSFDQMILTWENDGNQAELNFFNDHVAPLINHAFNWNCVDQDNPNVTFNAVMKYKFISMEHHKRIIRGRCGNPIWSNAWLDEHKIHRRDSAICNGHNLELALIIDRVLEGFHDKLSDRNAYVGGNVNVRALFDNNAPRRLWEL